MATNMTVNLRLKAARRPNLAQAGRGISFSGAVINRNHTELHRSLSAPSEYQTDRPITLFPVQDERFAVFAYLQTLADKAGADRYTYVTLKTHPKKLKELLGEEVEIIRELRDEFSQTVAHIATQYCTAETLALLLDHGAEVDSADGMGYSPLFYAAMSNNPDTAALLLARGAGRCC